MTIASHVREASVLSDIRKIPGLVRWYSSRYPLGLTGGRPADGTALSSAPDLSLGTAYNLPQGTAANQPLWRKPFANLCPGFDQWTLTGGATVDNAGILTLPTGATATSPLMNVGAASLSAAFSAEYNAGAQSNNAPFQPNGGRLATSLYYAADGTTPASNTAGNTTNGNARAVPVGSYSDRLIGGTVSGTWNSMVLGPNVINVRMRLSNDTTYGSSSPLLVRLPQFETSTTTTDNATDYVPCSSLPLICSTEQNPRWFYSNAAPNLPIGAFTAYTVHALGNVSLGSRWLFGSTPAANRSMILVSSQSLITYGPTVSSQYRSATAGLNLPRAGRLRVSSHIWPNLGGTALGIGQDGNPFAMITGGTGGTGDWGDFSVSLGLLGYSTASAISGGYSDVLLCQGAHSTYDRKRVEKLLGALASIPIPNAA